MAAFLGVPLWVWATGGLLATGGYSAGKLTEMFEEMNEGAKLALVGGGLYVSYRAMQSAGVLK